MGMSYYVSPMLFLLEWACLLPLLFLISLLLVQFYCYVCRAEIFDGLRRIVPESCDCGNLCWAHLLVFSPLPPWPGHIPTYPFSPLLRPCTRKPKAMMPRLRFFLPPLASSWQRPRRIAKLSKII